MSTGGMDLNSAAMQLAKEGARKQFGSGMGYIVGRTLDLVYTLFGQVHRINSGPTPEVPPGLGKEKEKERGRGREREWERGRGRERGRGFSFTSLWLMEGNEDFDTAVVGVLD